nr:zinc finger protein 22-like [Parasteatoda tepidariorum]
MSKEFSASLPVNDEVLAMCDFGDLTGKDLDAMLKEDQVDQGRFPCPDCMKSFTTRPSMLRHQRSRHGDKHLQCPDCSKTFSRADHLKSHMNVHKRRAAAATPLSTSKQSRLENLAATSTSRLNTCPM